MITHQNTVSACIGIDSKVFFKDSDVYVSYLPMAHIMERNLFNQMMRVGGSIGLFSGDITKIKDDLAILKPTVFASVPRLFNKMHDAIK